MSNHTPGPWVASDDGYGLKLIKRIGYADEFCTVQHLMNTGRRGFPASESVKDESYANVRLMAMSPTLLAGCVAARDALHLLVHHCIRSNTTVLMSFGVDELSELAEMLNSAIAEARGEIKRGEP